MAPGFVSRVFGRVVPAVVLVVAVSGVVWSARDSVAQSTFAPTFDVVLADDSPGAASTITFGFDVGSPDANFHQLVSFAPPEFEFAPDDEVTTGAFAATVNATATLGLVNGACNSALDVTFEMFEASTDITQTIPLYSGTQDFNGNGLVENIDRYPAFLANIAPNVQPIQRLYGQIVISGLLTPLNFVLFEPGALLPLHPELEPALGYPIVVTLLDPTAPIENSSVSDFCTPLSTTTEMFGMSLDNPATVPNEAGQVLHRNPAEDGEYAWTMFARSRWDADGDGIENELDPCPYDSNPEWDPRANVSAADPDGDGLPSACDFAPNDYNSDQDGDGFLNRLDLCPLIVNVEGGFFMYDADNDGVGDACDRDISDDSDGGLSTRHQLCVSSVVAVGAGGDDAVVPACPEGPDLAVPPLLSVFAPPFQAVGESISVSASLRDPLTQNDIAGVTVEFEVTGANLAAGDCVTDTFGHCGFDYVGTNAGTDVVEATATANGVEVSVTREVEWLVPPENDGIENAVVVDALPFEHEQTINGATLSDDEPGGTCVTEDETVWFKYTPQDDQFVTLWVTNADGHATVSVYEGESLQFLGCSHWGWGRSVLLTPPFTGPQKGTYYTWLEEDATYYFQLNGFTFEGNGGVTFGMDFAPVGDADCDGDSDTSDAFQALRKVAFGVVTSPCIAGGDVNCDREIEPIDALEILRRVAGLSNKVGCG